MVPQTEGGGSVGIFHLRTQEKVSQIRLGKIFGGSIASQDPFPPLKIKGTEVQGKTLHSLQWSVPTDQKKGVFSVMAQCPRKGSTDQANGELDRLIQLRSRFHVFLLPEE